MDVQVLPEWHWMLQPPQLLGSAMVVSLQPLALTEQHRAAVAAPHCLLRQAGSRQSMRPLQLLSMPSLQFSTVPVAHTHPGPPSVSVPQV